MAYRDLAENVARLGFAENTARLGFAGNMAHLGIAENTARMSFVKNMAQLCLHENLECADPGESLWMQGPSSLPKTSSLISYFDIKI